MSTDTAKDLLDGAEAANAAPTILVTVLRGNFFHDKKPIPVGEEVVVVEADVAHLIELGFLKEVEQTDPPAEPATPVAATGSRAAKKKAAAGDQQGPAAAVAITDGDGAQESGAPSVSIVES